MAAGSIGLVCYVAIISFIGMSSCKEKFNQNMGKGESRCHVMSFMPHTFIRCKKNVFSVQFFYHFLYNIYIRWCGQLFVYAYICLYTVHMHSFTCTNVRIVTCAHVCAHKHK